MTKLESDNQTQNSQINGQVQNIKNNIEKVHNKQFADATAKFNSRVNSIVGAINKAKNLVATDNEQVSSKNDINAKAQKKLNADNNKLANEKKILRDLESHGTESIIVTPDFINGWKDYTQIRKYDNVSCYLVREKYPKIWEKVHNACIQSSALNGEFQANPADEKVSITFDANGILSRKDIIEATKYAVQLLNPIREQIGITPLGITNASIDIAAEVAKKYQDDNWDTWKDGHDGKALESIADEWGTDFVDEDLAGTSAFDNIRYSKTLADLKRMVYESILLLLFEGQENDNEMGHTTSLLGVRPDWASTDFIGVTYTLGTNSVHFNLIEDGNSQHVKNVRNRFIVRAAGSTTDKTIQGNNYAQIAVPSVADIAALKAKTESQIKEQQAIVNNDNTAVLASQNDLESAKSKLSQDQKDLLDKQSELAQLKTNRVKIINDIVNDVNNSKDIKNLQSQLVQLNKRLEQQKVNYDQAVLNENNIYKNKFTKLTTNYNQKLAAIAAQPENIDALKSQLQTKLDTLKKSHEAKLAAIQSDAQVKIDALKKQAVENDPEIANLQAKIAEIKANLAKQQKALDDQFTALKAKDAADYNALEQKLKNSSSEAAKGHNDHYNTSDGHKVVLPSDSGSTTPSKTVSPASATHDVVYAAKSTDTAVQTRVPAPVATTTTTTPMTREEVKTQNEGKTLPQTGNESGILAMVFGSVAAMFGLGFAAKKRY